MDREKFTHLENYSIGAAISEQADAALSCWASPEGLPAELLDSGIGFELPKVYMRMRTAPGQDGERLEAYLENEVGLVKGEDFIRHGNGMRGGVRFVGFIKPDIEQRFERFMTERGIEPGEKPDYDNPGPKLRAWQEQRQRESAEQFEQSRHQFKENSEALGIGMPFSTWVFRYLTKSLPPRSR